MACRNDDIVMLLGVLCTEKKYSTLDAMVSIFIPILERSFLNNDARLIAKMFLAAAL